MAVRIHGQSLPLGSIADGEITLAKIAAGVLTGAKLAASPFVVKAFVGHNLAGACTVSGLTLGQRVVAVFGAPTAGGALVEAAASFESTVSVAGQLQQTSATDLSAKTYVLFVMPAAS